ncbi:3-methyl-2-oxobutanoate hydroxymethyltransferase [Mucisphaera calidilacus]|uniref:3-methyl-2-oxobutanoate hydroxymethyltransferase n=1 Tax=Mucisphaera calidilacus TaxID=2527982 RepID=A0A518BZK1_9BACT|nr:3-methyl-2-oxobutanoate hydroxymethyltransferase [Mucisphaera calidilacus]QDU72403.1 3-methyl-2-oxobutanoate hydroxymethyltransferase [Mucisphaera calidilacus]
MPEPDNQRYTIRHLRHWAREGQTFPMLTCYSAPMAQWLWRGGIRTLLVGDTAAQTVLGHDSTLPANMPFMLEITRAVRRGAPNVCLMADMPFGSYQCGDDLAITNAAAFLKQGDADLVKLEVDDSCPPLVERMTRAGIPVVAHIGSRPQTYRSYGTPIVAGRTERVARILRDTATAMIQAGAVALLIEAVPDSVTRDIVEIAVQPDSGRPVPVIGCGAGPGCHGYVVVINDLLGLSDQQPSFATPLADIGQQIQHAAGKWHDLVTSDQYVKEGGPYGE